MPQQAPVSIRPITDGDDVIRRALEEAHIPTLMLSLVHLTGDESLLSGDIRLDPNFFGDPQCGISPQRQAHVRALAFEALRAYRDGKRPLAPNPDRSRILAMLKFLVGDAATGDYAEFLESELSLDGRDGYAPEPFDAIPADRRKDFHVVVIGAGMSGLLAAIRLDEAGVPFTVIEKNANVGGTWYENTYPGCRVDSPNHTYSYSFAPKDWPQHFSDQKVLLSYFDEVATRYDLRRRIRLETEVTEARWDEASQRWLVAVKSREGRTETVSANAIVAAVGQLNRPRFPDIPGRDRFAGASFHSAQWRHDVSLAGKRVGVIGTGASAFQFVPVIADEARHITIFQRTPPWVSPRAEYFAEIPDGKHWLLNHVPFYAKWYRFWMFWRTSEGLLGSVRRDPGWNDPSHSVSPENDMLRQLLTAYVRETIGDDPALLAKTIPNYPPAGKRMLVDDGRWLRTLKRDNVTLTEDRIREIDARGLVTQNGVSHAFDVIVYGTGFTASDFLMPMKIYGAGGRELHEHWNGDARAYLGITVPGFPNLFCMYGPNTNIVVNGSIIFFSECEMRYIMGCVRLLLTSGRRALDCKRDVHDRYNERVDAANLDMAWGSPHVTSWYKNRKGRVTQNWPFTLLEFWSRTRAPDPQDYVLS
jgi:4-hydroxyacetophenone monooxygenase